VIVRAERDSVGRGGVSLNRYVKGRGVNALDSYHGYPLPNLSGENGSYGQVRPDRDDLPQ
jgi:hypothetical protein